MACIRPLKNRMMRWLRCVWQHASSQNAHGRVWSWKEDRRRGGVGGRRGMATMRMMTMTMTTTVTIEEAREIPNNNNPDDSDDIIVVMNGDRMLIWSNCTEGNLFRRCSFPNVSSHCVARICVEERELWTVVWFCQYEGGRGIATHKLPLHAWVWCISGNRPHGEIATCEWNSLTRFYV